MAKLPPKRPYSKQFGKLVWEKPNGTEEVIDSNKEWHVLSAKRKELLQNPYYSRGKLKLKYM